ncbi:hypothetical protein [Providencia sp. Me31A]|uniref:hypothetical protein n=1 Tax=Providencia sp. Me31A TaxID=3392637 RepID=UPI003D2A7551
MKTIQNITLNQRIVKYINSHNDKSPMTQAIKNIKFLSDNLPKIDNNNKITTKTIIYKDLKAILKQIDSVIKDTKIFLAKSDDNNASIRPSQEESMNMQENLNLLKEQMIDYKTTVFSISTYEHNTNKIKALYNATNKIEDITTKVTQSNIKNNQLTKQPEIEKNKRTQELNERAIKRTDYENSLNNR